MKARDNVKKIFIIISITIIMIFGLACSDEVSRSKELNVYMLNDSEIVRSAIECYQAKVLDIRINIEVGVPDYETTVSDALKKLNTRLLAGDGPDIIVMDDIKIEKYIQSEQLLDLSNIASTEKELSSSVIESSRYGEKIYALPISIALIADIQQPEASIDFSSLKKFNKSIASEEVAIRSLDRQAALWYRSKIEPKILSEEMITLAELKAFYQDLKTQMYMIYGDDEELRFASFQQINLQVVSGMAVPLVYFKEIGAAKEYIDTLSSLQMLCSMKEQNEIGYNFVEWNGKTRFIPMGRIAVNAESLNSEEAVALISYLVSEEGQKQIVKNVGSIPVNIKALKYALEHAEQSEHVIGKLGSYKSEAFSKRNIDQITHLINEESYSITTDGTLMEIIMLGAQDYLNGKATLDHAAEQALKKVGIYLAE